MKKGHIILHLAIACILSLILGACTSSVDAPAQTVALYYQALVEKDEERLVNLSCGDWESMALMELDSFMSVETTLTDVSCQTISEDKSSARVTCEGAISASYDGEAREFPLTGQTYLVVQEGGEWRMCGYE